MAIIDNFGNFNRVNSGVFSVYSATLKSFLHLFDNIHQGACQLLFDSGSVGTPFVSMQSTGAISA